MADVKGKIISTHDVDAFPALNPVLGFSVIKDLTSSESSTTIAAGDCVIFDFTATDAAASTFISTNAEAVAMAAALYKIKQLPTGTATGTLIRGVALESIAAGASGKVCVGGFCPKVHISDGDVVAGDPLIGDGEAAGECEKYVIGTHTTGFGPFGVALTGDATNDGFVACWIYPRE